MRRFLGILRHRHHDDPDERNVHDFFVGPGCEISNDPSVAEAATEVVLCNIRRYMCMPRRIDREEDTIGDEDDAIRTVTVSYEYEMHYNRNSKASESLLRAYMEEVILQYLASVTGTIGCTASRHLVESKVLGVSSDPVDIVLDRECTMGTDTDLECMSILGGMTFWLTPEGDPVYLTSMVLDYVREGMEDDRFIYPGNIEKVIFVGNTHPITKIIPEDIDNIEGSTGISEAEILDDQVFRGHSHGRVSAVTIAFSSLALMVILLAASMLATKRKRLDSKEADEASLSTFSLASRDSLALKPQHMEVLTVDGDHLYDVPPPKTMILGNMMILGRAKESPVKCDGSLESSCKNTSYSSTSSSRPDTDPDEEYDDVRKILLDLEGEDSRFRSAWDEDIADGDDDDLAGYSVFLAHTDAEVLERSLHNSEDPGDMEITPPSRVPQSRQTKKRRGFSRIFLSLSAISEHSDLSRTGSEIGDANSECTPRRVLQMA